MTTWPSASKASTTNLDSGTDKPRLARADIKQNVDNVNDIIDYFTDDTGDITIAGDQIGLNKGYKENINTLTSDTNITVDANTASVHSVTLAHNATFTISNMTAGQSVSVIVTQDGTGNRTGTFTSVKFPTGVTTALSTGASDIDIINIFYDGTNLLGTILKDFA
jgi:hypothetical protein